jgi:hypothetical protein
MDIPTYTKHSMRIASDQEEISQSSKFLKNVLSLSIGEDSSCSLETKQYRRTLSGPKLFQQGN